MESMGFLLLVAGVCLVFVVATVLLNRLFKEMKGLRYIPAITAAAATAAFFIKASKFSEGMEGLAYVILAMLTAAAFIVSIVTALILGVVERRRQR